MDIIGNILSGGINKVINNVASGFDELFTSDDERLQAKNILKQIQAEMHKNTQDFEIRIEQELTKRINAQRDIIVAEAKNDHWVVSSWRPITALVFTFIIANNYIFVPYAEMLFSAKIPKLALDQNIWELLKLMIGGYVVGRSVEKTMKAYKNG